MKVSVIHPTARPRKALEAMHKWLDQAANLESVEYILAIDSPPLHYKVREDDILAYQNLPYERKRRVDLCVKSILVPFEVGSVKKANEAAKKSTGDILIQASDDVFPQKDWDRELIEATDWDRELILFIDEGHEHKETIPQGMVMSRKRYEKQGYFYHPEFRHLGADNYHLWKVKKDGCPIVKAEHILFQHNHWCWGRGRKKDRVDEISNSLLEVNHAKRTYKKLTGEEMQ